MKYKVVVANKKGDEDDNWHESTLVKNRQRLENVLMDWKEREFTTNVSQADYMRIEEFDGKRSHIFYPPVLNQLHTPVYEKIIQKLF